jgi:S1-C subfamily serine protease
VIHLKRIFTIFIIITSTFLVSGCQEPTTYEDLLVEFQEHLESNHEIYQEHLDFFNTASTETIKTVVMVSVNVIPTNELIRASGVIFNEDETFYYVLTNHHVVHVDENEQAIYRVLDYQGNIYQASLITSDPNYDLAILKFSKSLKVLKIIEFDYEEAVKDDYLMIMGYPNTKMIAMTMGTVIGYDLIPIPHINENDVNVQFDVMITYAPVNYGSSGSLVINENSSLIGIVFTASIPKNDDISEATFIIPLSKVKEFTELHMGGETS